MTSSKIDLVELVKKLKFEKLFIANERREIENLNKKVQLLCTNLLQQSWLTGQHRLTLENLSRGQIDSPFSNEYVTNTDGDPTGDEVGLELIEAQRFIPQRYYHSYVELLTLLRTHPDIVGLCISTYEREKQFLIPYISDLGTPSGVTSGQVLQAIINVYGGVGGPLPGDSALLLKLLSVLAGLQVVGSESPRRVLRQGSTAFSSLFRLISETIPSARLFLVGALHHPVTQLLSTPEFLKLGTTISPTTPLSMEVSLSTFGAQSTNKDIALLDRTEKMAELTKLFLESILDNIHAFPTGLAWLIQSIHQQLKGSIAEKELNIICIDLIWALFICPAVTNPEPFGVTDAPVGTQERHILSQVATILQALALYPYEPNPQYLVEYISFFDTALCSSVLDTILNMEKVSVEDQGLSALFRRTILLPENQLVPLFAWFKETLMLLERNGKLTDIEIWPLLVKLSSSVSESLPPPSPRPSPTTLRSASPSPSNSTSPSHRPTSLLSNGRASSFLRKDAKGTSEIETEARKPPVQVLVFPITNEGWEWVGMLPESEVQSTRKSEKGSIGEDLLVGLDEADGEEERSLPGEKRTRFSISQDEGSIGTSDNLEAVSEAASTHSVSSSIELEDQNDNLSDMMSANVSGRGSPNVSGRNSPLSQADEQVEEDNVAPVNLVNVAEQQDEAMEQEGAVELRPNNVHNINPPNINNLNLHDRRNPSKQARSEIDDKFCKFEIKKLFGGDETISLVSDTWSTDVMASDSEMGGDGRLLLPLPPDQQNQSSRASIDASAGGESMSEAWSTDVAASDIERLHDFDTEETGSVARSDYTGRSEVEPVVDDTPRSSISGGRGLGLYPTQQPIDILLFGELPPPVDDPPLGLAVVPADSTSGNEAIVPMDMEVERPQPEDSKDLLGLDLATSSSNSTIPLASGVSSSRAPLISKTITFDKTAERGDRYDEETGRTKKFFKNFKIFRGRVGRKTRGGDDRFDWTDRMPENPSLPVPKMRKSLSEEIPGASALSAEAFGETSDDILAKYRRKPSLTDSGFSLPVFPASRDVKINADSNASPLMPRKESIKFNRSELASDARKKLRSVLGNCDLQLVQEGSGMSAVTIDGALVNILRIEVASAISRADNVTAAQLQEAIRTIQQLRAEGCKKVVRQLRDDYRRRSDYVSYLIRAKQGLLSTLNFLERGLERSRHEGETYTHYLVTEWIRLRLEEPGQDSLVEGFITNFRSSKTVDEKMELLESFLTSRLNFFLSNRKELTQAQIQTLAKALEQYLVTHVYWYALHPNGEVDVHRDVVLREHIAKLGQIVTTSHKDLRIPKSHLSECPWPPAQRELRMLSAYRTASDKLRCVLRACSLILSLISTSAEKAMAADDFVPVLVYVMIKSNPPALLSTIQYVNSFYGGKMTGEEEYWWTQFCSAVEFIKMMDYND